MAEPEISVVIPTFREGNIIPDTLAKLYSQTVSIEIIVCDYDPDGTGIIEKIVNKFNVVNKTNIKYLRIDRPGIAYARHQGIMAARGKVIVNFDADAVFSKNDDIYQMARPILVEKNAVLTCCDNVFYSSAGITDNKERQDDLKFANMLMEFLNRTQAMQPVYAFLEPGSCFSKDVYVDVGGFNDLKRWELTDISGRIFYRYPFLKMAIRNVTVFVSPRRAINLRKHGFEVLNYDLHFKEEEPLKT